MHPHGHIATSPSSSQRGVGVRSDGRVAVGLIVVIGTKLMPEPSTKADFAEAFRVIGFTASPGVFNIFTVLPIVRYLISFAIGIWMHVIGVIAVREVLDYSDTGRAIIVCVIAFVIYCIVLFFVLTQIVMARVLMG